MRTEELVSQIYQISEKVSQLLAYEIRGKTVGSWLASILKFSFVIWVGIILWQGYQYFLKYKNLQQQITHKENILKQKENQLRNLKYKLHDIKVAYQSVSKIFSKKKVRELKRKINKAFTTIEEQDIIISPVKYEGFNYRFQLGHRFFASIKGVSLADFSFRSSITDYFRSSLDRELRKSWYKQHTGKKGSIQVTLKGNTIVMYFTPKGYYLYLKPLSYVGFVKDIYQPKGFLKASFIPYEAIKNDLSYSPIYIGWDFSLK